MRPISPDQSNVWNYDQGCIYQDVEQVYSFDNVFGPETQTKFIYKTLKEIIDSAADGINGTVFMYGQTGSGKTYSMIGNALNKSCLDQLPKTPKTS